MQHQIELPIEQGSTYTLGAEKYSSSTIALQAAQWMSSSFFQRFRNLMEAALGFTAIEFVSMYLPKSWLSSHLLFCSFFLIVFASAVRYQRTVAYGASVLATCGYGVLLYWHPELRGQVDVAHLFVEPFLLFITGILTSELLLVQRNRFIEAQQQCEQTEKLLQDVRGDYQKALTVNEGLERQIAGQSSSVVTVLAKVAQLVQNGSNHVAIADMMKHALGADDCALYLHQNGQMQLATGGQGTVSDSETPLNIENPLLRRVMQQRRVCTVREVLAEVRGGTQELPVMAGPLISREGNLVGVVVINAMPLLSFTPAVVQLFSSLLNIASMSF